MNKCETCKHWGVGWRLGRDEENVRKCSSPKIKFGRVAFSEVGPDIIVDDDTAIAVAADEAAAMDGSGYYACLKTGPAFGCIHWEGK